MDAQTRLNLNGAANVIFAISLVSATVIAVLAILQTEWPWWLIGFALCGFGMIWGLIVCGIAHVKEFKPGEWDKYSSNREVKHGRGTESQVG